MRRGYTNWTDRVQQSVQTIRAGVLVGALSLIAVGLLGAGLGLLAAWLAPASDRLSAVLLSTSLLGLGAGLGSALAWQAWQAIEGKATGPFRPGRIWPLAAAFALAIVAGQAVLARDLLPMLTLPPLHLAAAGIPPLVILALAGRHLGATSRWRDVVLQLSSGAFLSTSLALLLELGILLSVTVLALSLAAMSADGLEQMRALATQLQDPAWLQNPAQQSALLTTLIRSPAVVALIFLTVSGLIPLIEEVVKTIGVGLLAWRRPTRSQAVFWGLAGGAGFALTEGLLSSAGTPEAWAPAVLARAAAMLFHSLSGALIGLAWYAALAQRSWPRALGLYVVSASLHGLWNGLAAGAALLGLTLDSSQPAGQAAAMAAAFMMGFLALAAAFGLGFLVRSVTDREAVGNPP